MTTKAKQGLRILRLASENVKRIKVVEIKPDGNVQVLSGLNGNGKSSVLDSIRMALEWKVAKKDTPYPVRKGAGKGWTELDLGDYIVKRTYIEQDDGEITTSLKITTPDGSTIRSPQTLLDNLIGDLAFDPLEFSRLKDKEQREALGDLLFKLTNGTLDLSDFERRHKEAYDQRSSANREKKRLAGLLTAIRPPVADEPQIEVSVADATKALNDAMANNQHSADIAASNDRARVEVERCTNEIKRLEEELEKVDKAREKARAALMAQEALLTSIPTMDIKVPQKQLEELDVRNKRAREITQYNETRTGLEAVNKDITGYNETMELVEIEKAEALEKSPLPVDDLFVTEDGIMVVSPEGERIPFSQASTAQRLRISMAIGMASNPTLRVMTVADGSLLDDDSMAIISDMADANDYQLWIEYSSRNADDRIGVYLEDGEIVA